MKDTTHISVHIRNGILEHQVYSVFGHTTIRHMHIKNKCCTATVVAQIYEIWQVSSAVQHKHERNLHLFVHVPEWEFKFVSFHSSSNGYWKARNNLTQYVLRVVSSAALHSLSFFMPPYDSMRRNFAEGKKDQTSSRLITQKLWTNAKNQNHATRQKISHHQKSKTSREKVMQNF